MSEPLIRFKVAICSDVAGCTFGQLVKQALSTPCGDNVLSSLLFTRVAGRFAIMMITIDHAIEVYKRHTKHWMMFKSLQTDYS